MERKFFVLVPVYKTEKYMDDCIQSVLNQTYDNFRLILVDDGTPDRAGEICDAYAEKDPRVLVIHKENGGQISARNAAMDRMLQEARDEDFAVFLDSDDTLKPHTLQTLQEQIEKEHCDMVIYGIDRIRNGKNIGSFDAGKVFTGTVTDKHRLYRTVFLSSNYNPLCRKAISTALVRKMQKTSYEEYLHIRLGEDLIQSMVLYETCEKAVFIEDRLYNYTDNPTSVSNSQSAENFPVDSTVRSLVQDFLDRQPDWTKEDMAAYHAYCRQRLEGKLRKIAKLPADKARKLELLQAIGKDPTFRMIADTASQKETAMKLLVSGKYERLLGYLQAKNAAASSIKKIKACLGR